MIKLLREASEYDTVSVSDLLNALEETYGDLDNERGFSCGSNGKWMSVSNIVDMIKSFGKDYIYVGELLDLLKEKYGDLDNDRGKYCGDYSRWLSVATIVDMINQISDSGYYEYHGDWW